MGATHEDQASASRPSRWCWPRWRASAFVYRQRDPAPGPAQPHPGGRPLHHRRGPGLPASLRGVLADAEPPRAVRELPPEDLRRVERLHDVQLLARSGLARGVPAARARDVDRRRLRHPGTRPTARRRPPTTPSPKRASARLEFDIGCKTVYGVALGLAARRVLLALPHADQLPRQRPAAERQSRPRDRPRVTRPSIRTFNPTSDNGTGIAFATLDSQLRNTESGKLGHLLRRLPQLRGHARARRFTTTRKRPDSVRHRPLATQTRALALRVRQAGRLQAGRRRRSRTWATAVGAGAYRLSPHAVAARALRPAGGRRPPRRPRTPTPARSSASRSRFSRWTPSKHEGFHSAHVRARRDVRRLPRRDQRAARSRTRSGKWVGGFPIERTYTEWPSSRYADRPGQRQLRSRASSATASPATCSRTTGSPAPRRRCTRRGTRFRSRWSRSPPTASRARHSRTTSWAATPSCPASSARTWTGPATSPPTPSCPRSASRRRTTRAPTRAGSGRTPSERGPTPSSSAWPGIACATSCRWR